MGVVLIMLKMDGFDEAFIGYATRMSGDIAVYDYEKMVKVLISRDKMTVEEAMEFVDYNCQGSWVGEQTPIILYKLDKIADYDIFYDA